MGLDMLIYCPLMEEEEEDVKGWDKQTIAYVVEHKKEMLRKISKYASSMKKRMQPHDLDETYQDLMMYLYRSDDYNLNKAIERSSTGNIVSLEGYVNSCLKCCVQRKCCSMYKEEKHFVSDGTPKDPEDEPLSILDTIADESSEVMLEDVMYNLKDLCRSYEPCRYKYGADFYLILYIYTIAQKAGKADLYKDLLDVVGITKHDLDKVKQTSSSDDLLGPFLSSIKINGYDKSMEILREYVYSADVIERAITEM